MIARAQQARQAVAADASGRGRGQGAAPTEEPISAALKIDDLKIELGYALLPLVNSPDGTDRLTEQIKALRRSLAIEMGFVMPAVRILDNVQLEANSLRHQDQGGRRRHRPGLAGPVHGDGPGRRPGERCPASTPPSRPSACPRPGSTPRSRKRPRSRATPWSTPRPCSSTHLTELIKANIVGAPVLCGGAEAPQGAAEGAGRTGQGHRAGADHHHRASSACCRSCWPSASRSATSPTILEGIADGVAVHAQPGALAEHVRARLARQICAQHTSPAGYLPLIALSAKWEQAFAESIVGQGDDRQLAMQPSRLSEFITLVRERFEEAARAGRERRCWSPRRASGRSCARSSSASARRPRCCRSPKSIRGRG